MTASGKQYNLRGGATTRWIMSRHHTTAVKVSNLHFEINELERQLKKHPLGAIILKAQIKKKYIELIKFKKLARDQNKTYTELLNELMK